MIFGTIYVVTDLETGMQYVGQTTRKFEYRQQEHFKAKDNNYFDNHVSKYPNRFEWEIVFQGECDYNFLNIYEEKLIFELNTIKPFGYNIKYGGNNHNFSAETKKQMSKIKIGKLNNRYGIIGKSHQNHGKRVGKYRGTTYASKNLKPWKRVWTTRIRYNKYRTILGNFNDPISGEIVYEFVFNEIFGDE